ncbi:dehydrogenase [Marmoricola endophyticus]|uniref:Pyridine nucleotide-disulfide oxidoreductase domain-containing protein 2 n=1 Tax=Marmoricola endophyticus TaxID=2040280 RepID=A0A917BMM0_9ACTN|nr:NAD(P)/FAD-dependent oxidoreductase [Marmoricola endophyticus]GGF49798.1 dehydrogenase [Marmoricola endophyticus]
MTSQAYDAVVVGAGHNGLVAANHLADAGWSVLILEEQQIPGGAVRSDREVHPDFVHDTFSAFYPFAAVSAPLTSLRLEDHGLEWVHPPAALGHPLPDGRWALIHPDRERTAAGLDELCSGDGDAWLALCRTWDRIGGPLVDAFTAPFPPLRHGSRLLRRLPAAGGLPLVRDMLGPVLSMARHRFDGPAPGLLLAGNAGHSDIPPTSPGSAAFGLMMTMLAQEVGFPVPRGGAGRLTDALVRRLTTAGGEVRTGRRVRRIRVEGGRASGVETEDGATYRAGRAVLADVTAPALFGQLLDPGDVPAAVRRQIRGFELDPGTVKVDWALSGPVPWRCAPESAPGTVHLADSVEEMALAAAQVAAGLVPERPFLLAGQMSTSDPTRSPAGTESLWAYTHVPRPGQTRGDAGGGDLTGRWDRSECERFADRVQARLEERAPGFGERVVSRRVLGPNDLQARDANLDGGAINGGTSQLHQDVVFRPVPAMLGRPATGVPGLFLASASAHPGGGVHGAPGASAARAALRSLGPRPWRRD